MNLVVGLSLAAAGLGICYAALVCPLDTAPGGGGARITGSLSGDS